MNPGAEPLPSSLSQIPSEPCHPHGLRQPCFGAATGYYCYVRATVNALTLAKNIFLCSRILLVRNSKRAQQGWLSLLPGVCGLRWKESKTGVTHDWALESSEDLFTHGSALGWAHLGCWPKFLHLNPAWGCWASS